MSRTKGQPYELEVEGLTVFVTRKRVKNVIFRFDTQGRPCMSVPWNMARDRVAQHAREHAEWFRSHAQRVERRMPLAPQRWETGEELRVWGVACTLRVCETDGAPSCSQEGSELVVCVPAGSTARGRKDFVERWLADELRARLNELLPECEKRTGLHATSVTLRRMKSRWGSCTASTGRIRINTALAECPPDCLEMVLVHELCHLKEPNHGPRFYALMDLCCPSWRVSSRWLNEHAPRA